MCGIAGFIGKDKDKKKILKNMCDRIKHRGPDAQGYYVKGDVALGQRRLSIIDIEGGNQPMFSKDEMLVVVFIGEIYNYQELKSDVLNIHDLHMGMELTGTVRNVTSVGAFVDIGLHDDGLVHISKMSKQFVSNPSDIVSVGDIVKVYVCKIDLDKEQVGLSLIKE